MKFLGKVFSILVILFTVYILLIFFAPSISDPIGKEIGLTDFNIWIRQLKGGADNFGSNLSKNTNIEEVVTGTNSLDNTLHEAGKLIQKTKEGIETTKQIIDTKVEQVNKVADSLEKAKKTVNELQQNISDLTTFGTGVSNTGTGTKH